MRHFKRMEARRAEVVAYLEARRVERDAAKESRRAADAGDVDAGDVELRAAGDDAARSTAVPSATAADASGVAALPTAQFLAAFNTGLQAARGALASAAAGGTVSEERGSALCAQWHASAWALQALLNASATGLPPYDVRKAQSALDALAIAAEETRGRVQPRKKFQFAARRAPQGPTDDPPALPATPPPPPPPLTPTAAAPPGPHSDGGRVEEEDDYTVAHRRGETIVVTESALAAHFAAGRAAPAASLATQSPPPCGDLRLLELTDCLVLIPAPMRALRVDRLVRCVVLAGPVGGSLLLHDCTDCTLAVASRQVRLHRSARCDLYLRPSSRPIIEHCTGLWLGPCGLDYPQLPAHLDACGLAHALEAAERPLAAAHGLQLAAALAGRAAGGGWAGAQAGGGGAPPESPPAAQPLPLWRSVDDFGWLRVQASPNWAALLPAQWMRDSAPTGDGSGSGAAGSAASDEKCGGAPGALAATGLAALPEPAAALCGMRVSYASQPWLQQPGGLPGGAASRAQAAPRDEQGASVDDEL